MSMLSPTEKRLLELTKNEPCGWFDIDRESGVVTEQYRIKGTPAAIETKTADYGNGQVVAVRVV